MSTWRALASSNQNKVEQLSDDDWETDGDLVFYFIFLLVNNIS